MRIPPNMALDVVDDPRPAPFAARARQLHDLKCAIERLFLYVHPEIGTTRSTKINGEEYVYASFGFVARVDPTKSKDAQVARLLELFLESLRLGWPTPHGTIYWRRYPTLEEYEVSCDPTRSLYDWEFEVKCAKEDRCEPPSKPTTETLIAVSCRLTSNVVPCGALLSRCMEGSEAPRVTL